MRILYYIHDLGIGGAECLVTEYLLHLDNAGHKVGLVVSFHVDTHLYERLSAVGIPVYSINGKRTGNKFVNKAKLLWVKNIVLYRRRWRVILDDFLPDILHIHTSVGSFPTDVYPMDKTVYTFHSEVSRRIKIMDENEVNKLQYMADCGMHFIAINKHMIDDCRNYFSTDNICYIPNGVDFSKVRAGDRNYILNSVGIPEDAFVVGHVGRFHPVKNHKFLIKVFKEILKHKNNAYLFLVGGGDVKLMEQVKTVAINEGFYDRVVFWGIRDDASDIMSTFDCMVLPSFSESFSLVLLEAQILGIRCVTSDAIPEEVVCNDNCFRLSLSAPLEFWAGIALGETTINKGNKSCIDNYKMDNVVARLIECYKQICNSAYGTA